MAIQPNTFKARPIGENVYWVGAIDWELSDFHGYSTGRGTTYNAYLILDDKITLIDTVKAPFREEMLSRIASVVEPGKIDYIVSNHSEMDHSGCLAEVEEIVKPEKVFASTKGKEALSRHFELPRETIAVKEGETVSLGKKTLAFLETPMLHWPDSMVTYVVEDKILFSQDAFGMHLASCERFADEIDEEVLIYEGAKYFANILLLYSPLILNLLDKVKEAGLEFNIIAPDHGPIWRKDPLRIVELYDRWARQEPTKKALVIFDTMWGSTALMARAIGEGLGAGGVEAKLLPLKKIHRSEVATEILDAGAVLVGSPTMNNNVYPTLAETLTYLKGLKPKNLIGAAFGSFGWSGEAVKLLEEMLSALKVEPVGEGIRAKYRPDRDDLARCYALGTAVAEKLKKTCAQAE